MRFEPGIYCYASDSMDRIAPRLALLALSDPYYIEHTILAHFFGFFGSCSKEGRALPEDMVAKYAAVAAELRSQQAFKNIFLMAVTTGHNKLEMLRNDVLLKQIRDYAGILHGDVLRYSRLGLENMKRAVEKLNKDVPPSWNT